MNPRAWSKHVQRVPQGQDVRFQRIAPGRCPWLDSEAAPGVGGAPVEYLSLGGQLAERVERGLQLGPRGTCAIDSAGAARTVRVADHEWPDGLREASHGPLSKPRGKRTSGIPVHIANPG